MEDGGRDLVNDIAPAGLPRFYTIPKTADLTQTLGYKTEQIISKQRENDLKPSRAPAVSKRSHFAGHKPMRSSKTALNEVPTFEETFSPKPPLSSQDDSED